MCILSVLIFEPLPLRVIPGSASEGEILEASLPREGWTGSISHLITVYGRWLDWALSLCTFIEKQSRLYGTYVIVVLLLSVLFMFLYFLNLYAHDVCNSSVPQYLVFPIFLCVTREHSFTFPRLISEKRWISYPVDWRLLPLEIEMHRLQPNQHVFKGWLHYFHVTSADCD